MMRHSHRHARVLWRRLCPSAMLYSEMLTASAVINGPPALLEFSPQEKPLALQLAGCAPDLLARAAEKAAAAGWDEINLNCGCPSPRVQHGGFGARMMKSPVIAAEAVRVMKRACALPVTVKCRTGVDNSPPGFLRAFVEAAAEGGADALIIHARAAWLRGLNPAQNRAVPPLEYARVYEIKREFPNLPVIINGGIVSTAQAKMHLAQADGVMAGREVARNPYFLAEVASTIFGQTPPSRQEAVRFMLGYLREARRQWGAREARRAAQPLARLCRGMTGAKKLRQMLACGGEGMDDAAFAF